MTVTFQAPEVLEDTWRRGERSDPDTEMRPAFRDDIDHLMARVERGDAIVPVQGRVSDWKSWMAVCFAQEANESGLEVTVFAPQTANRETAVERLVMFGAEYVEHAGRIDLCNWDDWREEVGRVDEKTCSEIPCPYYLDHDADIADRTEEALSGHLLENGMRVELDAATMREMGEEENQFMCPAQLYRRARRMDQTDGAVNAATYAKAFADAAVSEDDPLDSDIAILDEAHTVSMDLERVSEDVDPEALRGAVDSVVAHLDDTNRAWANRAMDDLSGLSAAVGEWLREAENGHSSPAGLFDGHAVSMSSAFDALDRVDGRLIQSVNSAVARGEWDEAASEASVYNATESIRGFLSYVNLFNGGEADFVHTVYQEAGSTVNSMAFRRVREPVDGGVTPQAVFDEWRERGTHPAIEDRWGKLLDRHIEAMWAGRGVFPGGDEPGAPVTPMEELRRISGADTLVTLSATHNDLSDPTRPPDEMRPTRHDLLCAPVRLRAVGCEERVYSGTDTVDPETPWFRDLLERAKAEAGAELAAVPINGINMARWAGAPVERLSEGDHGWGVVPNSRGSLGEKDLESLDIDAVLCGVQAQSPAPTARRLVATWETLAPRRDDPAEVLEESWRLLAQHVVSGTIQAGGRFDWDATNLVFERPGLFELAGFDVGVATADSSGFAGAFVRAYEDERSDWEDRRDALRAFKTVRYLEDSDRKRPSPTQFSSEHRRVYGADPAPDARAGLEAGRIGIEAGDGVTLTR